MSSTDLSGYSTDQLQAMLGQSGSDPAPASATPAPAQPAGAYPGLPTGTYQDPRDPYVVRNPDGSIYGLGNFHPDHVAQLDAKERQAQAEEEARAKAAGEQPDIVISTGVGGMDGRPTTSPAMIADYLNQHPELAPTDTGRSAGGAGTPGAPAQGLSAATPDAPAPAGPDLSGYSTADLMKMLGPDPTSPQGKALALARTDAAAAPGWLRSVANGVTFGGEDEGMGALSWVGTAAKNFATTMAGGKPALGAADAFHATMQAEKEAQEAYAKEHPLASLGFTLAGGLANPASIAAGGWAGAAEGLGGAVTRGALVGGAEGGLFGGLDADGGLADRAKGGASGAAGGAVLGGALPMVGRGFRNLFGGAPTAADAEAGDAAAVLPRASAADYALTGVDPALAITGGRSAQQTAQTLKGLPIVGTPLARQAGRTQSQALDFLKRTAAGYGDAADPVEAGAPIMAANDAVRAAADRARSGSAARIQELAGEYGASLPRQAAGDIVQGGVRRFAGVDHHAPVLDVSAFPVRASSFGAKAGALYDAAFDRLESEIPGGVRQTGDAPIGGAAAGGRDEVDDILDAARKGVLPKVKGQGPSLLEFISKQGGVRDDHGDLAAMDADKWHRDRPFARKLVNPTGTPLGDMAQTAYDAGYFPDVAPPSWEGNDQMQAVSGQDLAEAMRSELAGKRRFAGDGRQGASIQDEGVRSTLDFLDQHGIDPKAKTNQQIKVAFDRVAQGRSPDARHVSPTATAAVLNDINGRAQSPDVRGLLDAPQVRRMTAAISNPDKLSFSDLRSLRTWVRQAQKDDRLSSTIGMADLQRLEGALTEDIHTNASRLASPGAARQLRRADQFYAAGQKRISRALSYFDDGRQRSGEAVYDRVIGSASQGGQADIARLRALKRSLQPEDWREVASTAIQRMGQSGDGNFDLGRFIGGYSKLSPAGAEELFGGRTAALGRSLQTVVDQGRAALATEPQLHFAANSPEAAFAGVLRAASAKGGSADIAAVQNLKGALPPEAWGQVVSGVLNTIGRDNDGHFSPARFTTAWSKLAPKARETLFGGEGRTGEPAALDAFTRVMGDQAAAGRYYNHSNSAHAGGTLVAVMEGGKAALEGNVHHIALMAGVGAMGRMAAEALASPRFARTALRLTRASTPDAQASAQRGLQTIAASNPRVASAIEAFSSAVVQARRNPQIAGTLGAPRQRDTMMGESR